MTDIMNTRKNIMTSQEIELSNGIVMGDMGHCGPTQIPQASPTIPEINIDSLYTKNLINQSNIQVKQESIKIKREKSKTRPRPRKKKSDPESPTLLSNVSHPPYLPPPIQGVNFSTVYMNANSSWAEPAGLDKDDEEYTLADSFSPKYKSAKRKRKRKKSESRVRKKKKKRKFTVDDLDALNPYPKKKRVKKKNWNRSKYRGVTWDGRTKRWLCRVKWNGGLKYVGYFDSELEAAQRHDERARKMYAGNLSGIKLNFDHPPQLEQRKKRLKKGGYYSSGTNKKYNGEHSGVMNPSDSDDEDVFASNQDFFVRNATTIVWSTQTSVDL